MGRTPTTDSGLCTESRLTYRGLDDGVTQVAHFICGHGCTRIRLTAARRDDDLRIDDVWFLALVTHLWRFTCDCAREHWAARRRGGKVLSRRSLARARRWAADFRRDGARHRRRAKWLERISPVPVIWCEVPEREPEHPTETGRSIDTPQERPLQSEAA